MLRTFPESLAYDQKLQGCSESFSNDNHYKTGRLSKSP